MRPLSVVGSGGRWKEVVVVVEWELFESDEEVREREPVEVGWEVITTSVFCVGTLRGSLAG